MEAAVPVSMAAEERRTVEAAAAGGRGAQGKEIRAFEVREKSLERGNHGRCRRSVRSGGGRGNHRRLFRDSGPQKFID